jgi:GAF domain-containing protein
MDRRLRTFGADAQFLASTSTLVRETKQALETHADATFVRLAMDDGAGHYGGVSESDPAIIALRDRHKAIDLKTLPTQLQGEFAYPMISRGELVGVLILGPKRSGEAYAPDESHAIMQLAHEVGHTRRFLRLEGVLHEHHWPAGSAPYPASP